MAKLKELGQSSPRRREKLMRKNQQLATADPSASASPMSDLMEDILIEILLCLPHSKSLVQCSLVCKRWHSLITSDFFRTIFNRRKRLDLYKNSSHPIPFTLLFTSLQLEDDMILSKSLDHGINYHPNASSYLDFLPQEWSPKRSIRETSCGELLLSTSLNTLKFCVSNLTTKQWNILPNVPPVISTGTIGLWQDPNQAGYRPRFGNYKVVVFNSSYVFVPAEKNCAFKTVVFCSETGMWTPRELRIPSAFPFGDLRETKVSLEPSVASRGVLYFPILVGEHNYMGGFLGFDPSAESDECRFVDVPKDGFGDGWKTAFFLRVGVGIVRGKVRLWQLIKSNGCFELRVWELSSEDVGEREWVLVHDVRLARHKRRTYLSVVALDPNDVDLVFIVQNSGIWTYNIRHEKYEKIGQIPKVKLTELEKKYVLWNFLAVLPIVHISCHMMPM